MTHRLKLIGIFLIMAALLAACQSEDTSHSDTNDPGLDSIPFVTMSDSLVIEMTGVDSLTVFDILKARHQIDYFPTAAGVFVRAIDSISGDSRTFWMYSVNDSMAQIACDRYFTRTGDRIKWHFRRMEP